MSDTIAFEGLNEWQRAEVHRHLEQTYNMTYGSLERQDALMFRLPMGDPSTVRTEAPAQVLRALRDAASAGTPVKVGRMGKPDDARVSELLRQSADRAGREGRDGQVTQFLAGLWRDWDQRRALARYDEHQRAELVHWNDKPARRGAIT